MDQIISTDYVKHLYKDECNDSFLLFDFGEIYRFDDNNVIFLFFSNYQAKKALKFKKIKFLDKTDDGLVRYMASIDEMFAIIKHFKRRSRYPKNGNLIKKARLLLAHDIKRYTPAKFSSTKLNNIPKQLKQFLISKKMVRTT